MERKSGILMPISSLPSNYGIGTFGKEAYKFADFLAAAGQKAWQLLPLGPTSYGDSPYASFSTFAGNPYFIDLDLLIEDGLLKKAEVEAIDWGSDPMNVDYGKIYYNRFDILRLACSRGWDRDAAEITRFREQNAGWLPDYALFMALKRHFGMVSWTLWPDEDVRLRKPGRLEHYRTLLDADVRLFTWIQYTFYKQWDKLRDYVHSLGIEIIGDLPIYVALDSSDVWADPRSFLLDEKNIPTCVSGVPPDYFCEDGQLWGNPIYDWARMKGDGYGWWIRRIEGAKKLYDVIRIDHFRGFESYWSVPYGEKTAKNGKWLPGPGMGLVGVLRDWFHDTKFIAEDLGFLTPGVERLLRDSGFPGMKVLQFAFTGDDSVDLPHNYPRNCVAYPGTHDNNTLTGWFAGELTAAQRKQATDYFALTGREGTVRGLLRGVLASAAALAIIPLADWLEEPAASRMNTPGKARDNWQWRADAKKLTPALAGEIRELSERYFRTAR